MASTPLRLLFVAGSLEIGGVQSCIMKCVQNTPPEKVHFEIAVLSRGIGFHEEEFQKFGNVYHIPLLKSKNKFFSPFVILLNNLLCFAALDRLLRLNPPYDAIHCNLLEYTAPVLEAARKNQVPVRIAHSHIDRPDRLNPFHTWYYRWCAKRIEKNATIKLAVTEGAIALQFAPFEAHIIKNPVVDLCRLDPQNYNPEDHTEIRLIQIGTYSKRKNQCFSVEILKSLIDRGLSAQLTFIGRPLDGSDYIYEAEEKVRQLDLTDRVKFLPGDTDVPLLLSESDYMLIPSLREGLPTVALEAQAMGVPCFLSDNITRETDCGLCTFLPIASGAEKWAEEILFYRSKHGTEKQYVDMSAWDSRSIISQYYRIWSGEGKNG